MPPEDHEKAERLIYANWVRLNKTPYDVGLDFGYREGPAPPPDTYPVRLVMTWEHARDLKRLLDAAIKEYGTQLGEIRDFGGEVGDARQEGSDA